MKCSKEPHGTAFRSENPPWIVVDDHPDLSKFVSAMVSATARVEVYSHCSSREALDKFEAEPGNVACVLTDLEMPGMSGIELCRRLHELVPGLKVILMTGSYLITRDEAAELGFCGLLTKPFSWEQMRKCFEAAGALPGICPDRPGAVGPVNPKRKATGSSY